MRFDPTQWKTPDGAYEINVWHGQWSLTVRDGKGTPPIPADDFDHVAGLARSHQQQRGTREDYRNHNRR